MKKKKVLIKLILIAFFSSLIFSCTAPTDLTSWKDANYNKQFKKMLVVALIKDLEFRKAYENQLVSSLKLEGVSASSSLTQLPYNDAVSKKDLEKLVDDGKYDGLMILKYQGTKTTDVVRANYYDYYYDWYGYQSGPAYIERHQTVKMENILFSVEKKKAVWAGQTKTHNAWNADELAKSVSDEIIISLKKKN
jgi:hypothetical protein